MTTAAPRVSALRELPANCMIAVLKSYRVVISPLYGQVCRFFPSCSAYALEAVTIHGAFKGSALAVWRVCRCHPWNDGGVDHVPAGGRSFAVGKIPKIVVLNHPVIPADDESRSAA
ncbi:membrane protein insertion efficiency factor YidD [Arthrobacter sp. HLT1-21]